MKRQCEKIVNQRDDLINELPSKMVLSELQRIQAEKEIRQTKRDQQERAISELRGNLKLANEIVEADKCRLCGRKIAEPERKHIQNEIEFYKSEISRLETNT